ncbi:MAG: alpha/beta fold hydrolase, partial [Mycobacteriales bacterium]
TRVPMASLERNGVRLGYTETGVGNGRGGPSDRELVLIHGWGAHKGFLRHQQAEFAPRYRTLAVDLRGHGDSDSPETGYSIDQLASDTLWLMDQRGLDRPVVIGHGLGASVAIELACRVPQRFPAVVALDAPLVLSTDYEHVVRSIRSGLQTSHYAEALGNIVERDLFLSTDDRQVRSWVIEQMRSVPQHVLVQTLHAIEQWGGDSAVAQCPVPTYYVASATTPADLHRLAQLSPGTTLAMTPEVGHFHQLLAPSRVNALIAAFVDQIERQQARHGPTEPTLAVGDAASPVAPATTTPVAPLPELPSVPPLPNTPIAPPSLPPVV